MFTPLPEIMPNLSAVASRLDDVAIMPPPAILDIGQKLRKVFLKERNSGYAGVSQSEMRKLPYAYWVDGSDVLTVTDPDLVQKYWDKYLPEAISRGPRREKRWLLPLFYAYCERFSRGDEEFNRFSNNILAALQHSTGPFAQKLRQLHNSCNFFNPNSAPERLAELFFLDHRFSLDELIVNNHLWPGFVSSCLGQNLFKSALRFSPNNLGNIKTIDRLIRWTKLGSAPVVNTDARILFADAMLKPWARVVPEKVIRNTLIKFFLEEYNDPRLPLHRQFRWAGVSEQALAVFLNWLTGDTLQAFMKLLQRTADDIWEYRQKFWMAYYDNGYIDEAWIALGPDARYQATQMRLSESQSGMGFGRLEGMSASNQSVLLLRVGNLVFTEWSHNGSLRAYFESDDNSPRLYKRAYDASDLRSAISLDFHNGANIRPELTHAHSESGSWQRKARDFIRRHTNVYLRDEQII